MYHLLETNKMIYRVSNIKLEQKKYSKYIE